MKQRAGMTLIELQTASVLMGVILVAMGVVLVTALNAVRVLNDAHTVYWNALAAMKAIQTETMQSNRYGWKNFLSYAVPVDSVYGAASPTNENNAPLISLDGADWATELYLRTDANNPQTYLDDVLLHFYLNGTDLVEDNTGRTIARHIDEINFWRLAYNAVAVIVIAQGDVEDELNPGHPKHEALVSTIVRLRCAAAQSCEGPHAEEPGYAPDGYW